MNKLVISGIVLALIGVVTAFCSAYIAITIGNKIDFNDTTAVTNYLGFVDTYSSIFYLGLVILAIGILMLAVKYFQWAGTVKPLA